MPASPELVGVPAVTGFRAVRAGVRVLLGKGLLSLEPLRTTLYELVDFDNLRQAPIGFISSAVNVATGRIRIFDNRRTSVAPDHVLACCAMPISFSMVQLDGEYYWDASIATKASLQYLLNSSETDAFLLFQTEPEHFDRRVPTTFAETVVRVLDIGHISRLRMVNDFYHSVQRSALVMRRALEAESDDPAASHRETIAALAARPLISIVSVRDQDPGAASASLTRDSIRDAWARGDRDVTIALREGTVPPMAREDR